MSLTGPGPVIQGTSRTIPFNPSGLSYPATPANGRPVGSKGAEDAVRTLLGHLGYDPDLPGLVDTPARVVRALAELTSGEADDPEAILARRFPQERDSDLIVALTGIDFTALCEHHLLPFSGTATVAYIPQPGADVVGLSKLARLVDCYARRLTMQERITEQVTAALRRYLDTAGTACILRSSHECMTIRGVRKPNGQMVTSALTGLFLDDRRARAELLALTE